MARRYKMTGCARVFIVLIVITPIAFFIATYINQSDPVEVINEWRGKNSSSDTEVEKRLGLESKMELEKEVERLKKELEFYQLENEKLREQLKSYEQDHPSEE